MIKIIVKNTSQYRRVLHDYERASGLPRSLDPAYDLDDYQGFPEMCRVKITGLCR